MSPWAMVTCHDCKRTYRCTPFDDHYRVSGEDPEVRVCFDCLLARNGKRRA